MKSSLPGRQLRSVGADGGKNEKVEAQVDQPHAHCLWGMRRSSQEAAQAQIEIEESADHGDNSLLGRT